MFGKTANKKKKTFITKLFIWFVYILGASIKISKKKNNFVIQCISCYSKYITLPFQPLQLVRLTGRWQIFSKNKVKSFDKQRLLSSAINNKGSVDTGAKRGNYSLKVQSEKYSTRYMKYRKCSISLLMPKQTDLRDGGRPDSHVTAL